MQMNAAGVPDFRSLVDLSRPTHNQGGPSLSGKGTRQQAYLWHLAVTSLLHAAKRKFAHFSQKV